MRGSFGRVAVGVLLVGAVVVLAAGLAVYAGTGLLSWADEQVQRAEAPTGTEKEPPKPAEKTTEKKATTAEKAENEEDEARKKLDDKEQKEVADSFSAPKEAASEEKEDDASPAASAPADTTMSLDVPAIGLNDVGVYEGTGEDSLYAGTGHLSGTGYPWVSESNTYIAGHRVGYPGTGSDYVFWDLPALGEGDAVYLTDANGKTYEYAVSEILEVPITDLSVTAPVAGRDVVSLQTCIENYGDYWTEGPNWYVRYVVRADKVET